MLFAVKYRRQVVTINADGVQIDNPHSRHKLLQFTINGDEVYALDLGGAQHGFYEPVSPWKKCLEERVAAIEYIRPMAHIRESRDLSSGESTGNWSIARQAFNTKALSETLASAAKSWQVENGSLSAMLKLREEAFGRRQGELLDFIGKRVREAKGK